jgi:hypothetical protein
LTAGRTLNGSQIQHKRAKGTGDNEREPSVIVPRYASLSASSPTRSKVSDAFCFGDTFLFAKGDLTVPNPTTTAILRAGDLADRTIFFRNDLALAEDPQMSRNPHGFAFAIADPSALAREIARGAQQQVALFLASGGVLIIHPEPARFFEVPVLLPLPEGLSYIP